MLHTKRVLQTLFYALRRKARLTLRISPRQKQPPVLGQELEAVVQRHAWIARSIQIHAPENLDLSGKAVCEIGAGDCLASSALFLGKGASRVDIIEIQPPVVNEKQMQVLERLERDRFPVDLSIIRKNGDYHLDESRVFYHRHYMEDYSSSVPHAFIFSFSVLEHVEDFPGFFSACWRALEPGGYMLHLVDLGGHELFDEPLPPLDFQTYPDWLYDCMFGKYRRATRRFLNEHTEAIAAAGFELIKVTPTRIAEDAYLDHLWPKLRPAARARSRDELRVVEFAVVARKPVSAT